MMSHIVYISNQSCYKLVITQLLMPIYHIWHSQLCNNKYIKETTLGFAE